MRIDPTVVGRGADATVYACGPDRVAKVFHTHADNPAIDREAENTRLALACGLPVPRIYEVTTWDGQPAIIMDRVSGQSLILALLSGAASVESVGAEMATLHFSIHKNRIDTGLTSLTDWLEARIRRAPDLRPEEIDRLLALLAAQETGNRFCHNDFHPDNILRTPGGDVVIDWCDATAGNPWADVARTMLVFESRALPPDTPSETGHAMNAAREAVGAAYVARYRTLAGVDELPIQGWRVLVAASRLWLALPGETGINRKIVRSFLDGGQG